MLRRLTFTLESSFSTMYFGRIAIFSQCFYASPGHLPSCLESGFFVGLGFFPIIGVRFFLQVFYLASH